MKTKYASILLCLALASPAYALNPNPNANNYGYAETKEEFLQLLRCDIEYAKKLSAAGDQNAYRFVVKRLEAGYKHNWFMKNPGTALLCFVGGTVALLVLINALTR